MTPAQLNLRAALEASKAKDEGKPFVSPLAEINPHSLDEEFERITLKLAQGLPEAITDEDLAPVVHAIRDRRDIFLVEQAKKDAEGPKPKRGKAKAAVAAQDLLEISDLSELDEIL